MSMTAAQIKGRIKSLAREKNADARVLLRIFMMERFLERIAHSSYGENFVLKGGMLVTNLLGVTMRSTMDIDTTVRGLQLSAEHMKDVVVTLCDMDENDGVTFSVHGVTSVMVDMKYPGVRVSLEARVGELVSPLKIDISSGDAITPDAVEYDYHLLLEDRAIRLRAYTVETIMAEKLETILVRGVLNTRMRDFYDVVMLGLQYGDTVDYAVLSDALTNTCRQRNTVYILENAESILLTLRDDATVQSLWDTYRNKYEYARNIRYEFVMDSVSQIIRHLLSRFGASRTSLQ